jgi:hypothetical protein
MFTYLRRLAESIMRRGAPFHPFDPPFDPYAAVRQPRPTKPRGRNSAVALSEPEPDSSLHAVGTRHTIALVLIMTSGLLASCHAESKNADATADAAGSAAAAPVVAAEKPFVPAGRIEMHLSGGEYEIRPATDERIRVTVTGNRGDARIDVSATDRQGTINVSDTPTRNFSAVIEVPRTADLTVRLAAGNLTIGGVTGSKDVESNAGNVKIEIADPGEYASVDASLKAGDIDASAFGESKSGLMPSVTWAGKGKYTLRARLGAGNLELK